VLEAAAYEAGPELAAREAVLERLSLSAEPLYVSGDASALEQLFLNLILNAAQASSAGGIVRLESALRGDEIVVGVVDEGLGIDEEDRARVFDPFYSTREEGSGLGLSIVDRIVSAHGGSLTLESEVGVGTRVTVHLRRASTAPRGDATASPPPE
jgi:two-component system sensor histidine kinase AtoS